LKQARTALLGQSRRDPGLTNADDSRDYFLELGQRILPEVKQQIEARTLTTKFAKDWGMVMMCHGFISAHILDDSDGLSHQRAGQKSEKIRSKDTQKRWVARQIVCDDGLRGSRQTRR
jgi:hypothetical protein